MIRSLRYLAIASLLATTPSLATEIMPLEQRMALEVANLTLQKNGLAVQVDKLNAEIVDLQKQITDLKAKPVEKPQ